MDNILVGAAAGLLLASPVGAAALGLTLATAYDLEFDKSVNGLIDSASRMFIRNFFGE